MHATRRLHLSDDDRTFWHPDDFYIGRKRWADGLTTGAQHTFDSSIGIRHTYDTPAVVNTNEYLPARRVAEGNQALNDPRNVFLFELDVQTFAGGYQSTQFLIVHGQHPLRHW